MTEHLTLAERCRIHADKMSGEGWHVTANVLWLAAAEIDRLTPQPTVTVGLIRDDDELRSIAKERDGYRQQCVECLVLIGKLRDTNDELLNILHALVEAADHVNVRYLRDRPIEPEIELMQKVTQRARAAIATGAQ